MIDYVVNVPLPPSTNNLFATPRGKTFRVKSAQYKRWIDDAGKMLLQQGPRPDALTASLGVSIDATRPAGIRRDLDNLCKPILDLLVKMGVVMDDDRFAEIILRWRNPELAPEGVTVRVYGLGSNYPPSDRPEAA